MQNKIYSLSFLFYYLQVFISIIKLNRYNESNGHTENHFSQLSAITKYSDLIRVSTSRAN